MDFEDESELVTLAECDSGQELIVVRGLLESEGIECFCPALEWTSGIRKHRSELTIQVRQEDLAKARALLDATVEPSSEEDDKA